MLYIFYYIYTTASRKLPASFHTQQISQGNIAMSTALVSAFYDFSDVVYQNQKNRAQLQNMQKMESSRVVGSPVNLSPRNRSSPILGTAIMGSKPSPPPSPTEMISYDDATHQQVLQYAELLSQLPHRKLDRSVSESSVQSDRNNANKNINSTRYKTEMCRPFEENGHCKYGDKCQFAHGGNELRSLNRHPKYKTEFCRTFHTKGFCPYGPRCHFIHSENEGKLSEINQVKTEQQIQHQLLAAQATHLLNTATYSHVPTSPSHPHHFAQPIPARPKQLPFSLSMPIGSTADSPASSVSGDSPTLSPTSFQWNAHESNDVFSPVPVQSAPPTGLSNSFTFQDIQLVLEQLSAQQQQQQQQQQVIPPQPSQCSPLNVQTSPRHMSNEARLQQFLNQQNQRNNNCLRDSFGSTASIGSSSDSLYSAPSPKSAASFPESQSTCGSPLDISRSLRLPIFKDMC